MNIMMSSGLRGTVMIVVLSPGGIQFLLEVKRKIAQQNMKLCKMLLMRDETAVFLSPGRRSSEDLLLFDSLSQSIFGNCLTD